MYPQGTRVRVISLMDDPDPLPVGTEGTVQRFSDFGDWGQVSVKWDNGRSLMLLIPEDMHVFIATQ